MSVFVVGRRVGVVSRQLKNEARALLLISNLEMSSWDALLDFCFSDLLLDQPMDFGTSLSIDYNYTTQQS